MVLGSIIRGIHGQNAFSSGANQLVQSIQVDRAKAAAVDDAKFHGPPFGRPELGSNMLDGSPSGFRRPTG